MQKRIIALVLLLIFVSLLCSCGKTDVKPSDAQNSDDVTNHERSNLFGFVVKDGDDSRTFEAMHSFIVTCEDLGINAKLYRFDTEEELENAAGEAKEDNCDSVLFCSPEYDITNQADMLKKSGIAAVSLINENEKCDCSVVLSDNVTETLGMLSDMTDGGTVLLYSSIVVNATEFKGGSVKVKTFTRSDYSYKKAQESLYNYLLQNTDIKAIYATGSQNARPAALAAKQIGGIKVVGEELSEVNNELFSQGLYALCVSPYYEMTAKAVYAMQKLSVGEKAETEYCVKHLVTKDRLEKYAAISENAAKWFKR